jgi:hypothetical protein
LCRGQAGLGTSTGGTARFRVGHRGDDIDDADIIEGAREIVRGKPPGHSDVDEIRGEPLRQE